MTSNSYICRLMHENLENWQVIMAGKNISVKFDTTFPQLAIFKYAQFDADFHDPVVQEARGIIIDTEAQEVVCWPFRKFGNYQESYADDIDWNSARVQEKIDGSIIKLWYNVLNGEWQFSTNNVIDAKEAQVNSTGLLYLELIHSAFNYRNIHPEHLDKDKTYIFELVSPESRQVIFYEQTKLYHIGTRNNKTGEESAEYIGIEQPVQYPIHSFDAAIDSLSRLNANGVDHEGFVVVDKDWHRVKMKTMEYFAMHRVISGEFTKERAIDLIRANGGDVNAVIELFPERRPEIYYYAYKMAELERQAASYMLYAKSLYEELGKDRKAFAVTVKQDRLSWFAFKAIEADLPAAELIKRLAKTTYLKFIPDYKEERLW